MISSGSNQISVLFTDSEAIVLEKMFSRYHTVVVLITGNNNQLHNIRLPVGKSLLSLKICVIFITKISASFVHDLLTNISTFLKDFSGNYEGFASKLLQNSEEMLLRYYVDRNDNNNN